MASQPHYQPQRHDRLTAEQSISLLYHDIFEYPLKEKEFLKWHPGGKLKLARARPRIDLREEFYFLEGKEQSSISRREKESNSREKMMILSVYKDIFEKEPNILFVGITGSLAMNSASRESDIDLMVITKSGKLWQTRLKVLLKLRKLKVAVRKAQKSEQQDKLCMNIWMDESDLSVAPHNPYIAHEIAQIVPLINKEGMYDKLLSENRWVLDYWPNAVNIKDYKFENKEKKGFSIKEWGSYQLQKLYMSRKRTREVVTPTRAFFHPMDWSSRVKRELSKRGVEYT